MDDRRFDSLVKALASGTSRRSVLKGLLGLGGVALGGSALRDGTTEAARRPTTPTPTPTKCPGQQILNASGQCVCPTGKTKCGPDCCNTSNFPAPDPQHSECCDNACCFGTCYAEERCCPTNRQASGAPSTHQICETVGGPECCPRGDACCTVDGCCAGGCYGGADGVSFCCDTGTFCPGSPIGAGLCCASEERCCDGGTDNNQCRECCFDSDCSDGVCRNGTCVCLGLGEVCDYSNPECCLDDIRTQCNSIYPKDDCALPTRDDYCCRTAQGACSENCDCCLDLVCENSACCQVAGGFCYTSDECCSGHICVNDTCRSCGDLREFCSTSVPCCDPTALCVESAGACGITGQTCCHGAGGSCENSCDCCGNALICQNSTCCLDEGSPCQQDSNCCGDLVCELVCVQPGPPPCLGLGEACSDGVSCCSGSCSAAGSCCTTDPILCAQNPATCCTSCKQNGMSCDDSNECCDSCCIGNFTEEDWVRVCELDGITGADAQACAAAIIALGYPGTCLYPSTITLPNFPNNPVQLPCFV